VIEDSPAPSASEGGRLHQHYPFAQPIWFV